MYHATLENCVVSQIGEIICDQSRFVQCTLGDAGVSPPMPAVRLRSRMAGTSNHLDRCTFQGGVYLDHMTFESGTWHLTDGQLSGQTFIGSAVLGGRFGGSGGLTAEQTQIRHCTISNLMDLVCSGARLTDCEIMHSPGRGARLHDNSVISNSWIHHNLGGGIYCRDSAVRNCEIRANQHAAGEGGGVYLDDGGSVSACTIVENSAAAGGGVYASPSTSIDNSIVYFNTAASGANWAQSGGGAAWEYTCAVPAPPGSGNLSADPLFVPSTRFLAAASPCVNAGLLKPWMTGATDLAGHPRVVNVRPDPGAYEFIFSGTDYDGDGIANDLEPTSYGTDPLNSDSDQDGLSDSQELIAGTDPTKESSTFELETGGSQSVTPEGIVVSWASVDQRTYSLIRATNLTEGLVHTVASDIPSTAPLNVYTDTTAVAETTYFYRIGVRTE